MSTSELNTNNRRRAPKLTKDNWPLWSKIISLILTEKKLFNEAAESTKTIDPTTNATIITKATLAQPKPGPESYLELLLSSDDENQQHILKYDCGLQAWNALKEKHEQTGVVSTMRLIREFFNQELQGSMQEYINNIEARIRRLNGLGIKLPDQVNLYALLSGLPEKYDPLVMSCEGLGKMTCIDDIAPRLIEASSKYEGGGEIGLYVNKQQPRTNGKSALDKTKKENLLCSHCEGKGHTKDGCFKLIGYPDWHKNGKKKDKKTLDNHSKVAWGFRTGSYNLQNAWVMDSGASKHMTGERSLLKQIKNSLPLTVILADGSGLTTSTIGTAHLKIGDRPIYLEEVYLVPGLQSNLLSVAKISEKGFEVIFKEKEAILKKGTEQVKVKKINGMYVIPIERDSNPTKDPKYPKNIGIGLKVGEIKSGSLFDLHKLLGHVNYATIKEMLRRGDIEFKLTNNIEKECLCCIKAKAQRQPIQKMGTRNSTKVGDLTHTDVWGPAPVNSIGSMKWFVLFIDDFSKFIIVVFLKQKSDVLNAFKEYHKRMKVQFGIDLKVVRSDGGGEYKGAFTAYCKTNGIVQEMTLPNSPWQNPVSERMNRTLLEMARSMIFQNNLNVNLWTAAIAHAVYLRNRIYSRYNEQIPIRALKNDTVIDYTGILEFGIKVLYKHQNNKLNYKIREGIYLGVSPVQRGILILGQQGKIVSSGDYWKKPIEDPKIIEIQSDDESDEYEISDVRQIEENRAEAQEKEREQKTRQNTEANTKQAKSSPEQRETTEEVATHSENVSETETENLSETLQSEDVDDELPHSQKNFFYKKITPEEELIGDKFLLELARNKRSGLRPIKGKDRVRDATPETPKQVHFDEESDPFKSSALTPRGNLAFAFLSNSELKIPKSYTAATRDPDWEHGWKPAIIKELTAIKKNQTWKVVKDYIGSRKLPFKWVFTRKFDEHGVPTIWKARLVIGGHKQLEGVDFDQVYAATARGQTVRILLAYATILDYEVYQMDYDTAFLNGEIDTIVHMQTPSGLDLINDEIKEDELIQLNKALYGLRQSARLWKITVDEMMIRLGFKISKTDNAVYYKPGSIIGVYVDDLIVLCKDETMWKDLEKGLMAEYAAKSLGKLTHYLGMVWKRDRSARKSWLNQSVYCKNLLEKYDMANCNSISIPITPDYRKSSNSGGVQDSEDSLFENVKLYQSVVGSLIYLSIGTRPDLAYAINVVSRAMSKPTNRHWGIAKGIMRYLRGTINYGIQYGGNKVLVGYGDADWAADLETRRSMTGYVFMIGGPISWQSTLQKVVAQSTVEAEYYSLSAEMREGLWLKSLIEEIQLPLKTPIILMEDNQGCIAIAENQGNHSRTKHIDIKNHFIRDKIQEGIFKMQYCKTDLMIADIFTKPLAKPLFTKLRDMLQIVRLDAGGVLELSRSTAYVNNALFGTESLNSHYKFHGAENVLCGMDWGRVEGEEAEARSSGSRSALK